MKISRQTMWYFGLALTVRIFFFLWSSWGFYFHKPIEGLTLAEADFLNGYGIAAGYGYRDYFDQAEMAMIELMNQINRGQIKRITAETASSLPELGHYPNVRHPPGISVLVYFFHRLFGGPADKYILALSILLDSLAAVLLLRVVEKLLNRKIACIACLLYIVCLPLLFHTAYSKSSAGLMPFFLIAIVATLIKTVESNGPYATWGFVMAGFLLGVCSYFRPEYIVLPLFILPGIVWAGKKWTFALGRVAVMVLVTLAVLSPWAYRNHQMTQRWIFTSAIGPAAVYAGLGASNNPWNLLADDQSLHKEARAHGYPHAWSPEANDYFWKRFIVCIREHPLSWLKIILYKIPFAVATPYYWGFDWPQRAQTYLDFSSDGKDRFENLRQRPLTMLKLFWDRALMSLWVFLSFIGVIWMLIKQRQQRGWLFIFIVPHLVALTVHILIHWESRYTIPSLFVWVTGLAYFIHGIMFRHPVTPSSLMESRD